MLFGELKLIGNSSFRRFGPYKISSISNSTLERSYYFVTFTIVVSSYFPMNFSKHTLNYFKCQAIKVLHNDFGFSRNVSIQFRYVNYALTKIPHPS